MKRFTFAVSILLLMLCLCFTACGEQGAEVSDVSRNTAPTQTTGLPRLDTPSNLRIEDGVLYWDPVHEAEAYGVDVNGERNVTAECSLQLPILAGNGWTYEITVAALVLKEGAAPSELAHITHEVKAPVKHGFDEAGFEYRLLDDGSGYEVSKGSKKLFGTLEIPAYFGDYPVKGIAVNGFWSDSTVGNPYLTGIVLPANLEYIGKSAFGNCKALTEVVIPDTVTVIGNGAFQNCCKLTKVTFSKELKIIGASCFVDTPLAEITLPEGLEIIGNETFFVNRGEKVYANGELVYDAHVYSDLSQVVIPASVTSIGNNAFAGREKLASVTFEDAGNLQTIGADLFQDTAWENAQPDGPVYLGNVFYMYKGTMPENCVFEVPSSVKILAPAAFKDQKNLKKIILPKGAKLVGSQHFSGCTALAEVILPEDLTAIPSQAFEGTVNLKTIVLPDTLTEIGTLSFSGSGLEKIILPSGVKVIGGYAFENCDALTEVVLPSNLEKIDRRVFNSCDVLIRVYFGGTPAELEILVKSLLSHEWQHWESLPIYYYSETEPTEEGNYWHYVDGKPTAW